MATIIGNLQNATKALTVHRQGVTTAGRNMANVNNPEYARQRVLIGDPGAIMTPHGPMGMGVQVLGFSHVRDALVDREILREASALGRLNAEHYAYTRMQAGFGQTVDRQGDSAFVDGAGAVQGLKGIAELMTDLFASFHSLAANPASLAEKQSLLQKASALADKFNFTDQRLQDVRADLTAKIESETATVNGILGEIARLNREIGRFESENASQAMEFRDKRQAKLEELSQYIDFRSTIIPESRGQIRIDVRTAGGSPAEVMLLDKTTFNAVTFTDNDSPPPQTGLYIGANRLAADKGSIGGSIAVRDGYLGGVQQSIDVLARQIVVAVNGVYSATGQDFFHPAGLDAAGIRLDPGLTAQTLTATAGPNPGQNEIALALAGLESRTFSTSGGDLLNGTLGSHYRGLISDIGHTLSSTRSALDDQSNMHRLLKAQQDSVSGVSLDEEMTDLIKFQRAFEASARLVRIIDEMLDVLVNRMIR
ncbi:MAG: flagellar hook-associated protein FlgK [Puniceicoccaceae bacterium]|nr:MAG: flagellar hook-associated protein FlgK [Puniceicoccaceae bacterium]